MKRVSLVCAVALAGLATGLAAQSQPAPQAQPTLRSSPRMPIPVSALLPNTQALFDSYVTRGKMPGIVGAFGFGDGPTLFVAAGWIGDEPNAPAAGADSLWRVYSMTKPVTAMAAMILIEEGRIRLDDPVSNYIPAFANMRVLTDPEHSLASRPAARPITIRNLLTHTAGLGYNIVTKGPLLKEYERLGILPAAVNAPLDVQMRKVRPATLVAFADRVATLPLIADPGSKWSYSIGLDVMGRVIEVASGQPFDRFVNTRIFAPLGMTSSYWQVPADAASRLASNYAIVGSTRTPLDPAATSVFLQRPSFPYGGAGLVSSARDYDRFLHMIQNGGSLGGVRIASPATIALMTSNLLPAGVTFGSPDATAPMGFGAGGSVVLADTPGGPAKGTYGWSGAAGTLAWVNPGLRTRGSVMVNYFPANQWPLRTEIPAALRRDRARAR